MGSAPHQLSTIFGYLSFQAEVHTGVVEWGVEHRLGELKDTLKVKLCNRLEQPNVKKNHQIHCATTDIKGFHLIHPTVQLHVCLADVTFSFLLLFLSSSPSARVGHVHLLAAFGRLLQTESCGSDHQ